MDDSPEEGGERTLSRKQQPRQLCFPVWRGRVAELPAARKQAQEPVEREPPASPVAGLARRKVESARARRERQLVPAESAAADRRPAAAGDSTPAVAVDSRTVVGHTLAGDTAATGAGRTEAAAESAEEDMAEAEDSLREGDSGDTDHDSTSSRSSANSSPACITPAHLFTTTASLSVTGSSGKQGVVRGKSSVLERQGGIPPTVPIIAVGSHFLSQAAIRPSLNSHSPPRLPAPRRYNSLFALPGTKNTLHMTRGGAAR